MVSARGLDLSTAISDRILMLDIQHEHQLFPQSTLDILLTTSNFATTCELSLEC